MVVMFGEFIGELYLVLPAEAQSLNNAERLKEFERPIYTCAVNRSLKMRDDLLYC